MITELHIQGFKSLVDVKIPLGPGITVMVGPNNSGKTNVLSALKLVRECVRQFDEQKALATLGGMSWAVSRGRASVVIATQIEWERKGFAFKREWPVRKRNGPIVMLDENEIPMIIEQEVIDLSTPPPAAALDGFGQSMICDLAVESIRAESALDPNAKLEPDGLNLAAVLDVLANTNPDLVEQIQREVQIAAPEVKRILTPPGSRPGTKVIGIQEQSGQVFRADEISDGLLLLIAISTAGQLAGTGPGGFIAIEEPERGIHPRRLREVLDQFRRLANRGTQILLTTHSPLLLDEFRDHPESVLILDRDEQGTHVRRLSDHPEWQSQAGLGAPLGDLWYSGLLGGVPK